ncbi:MAG TPA: NEW3 domain-containing protein, partial [Candidatus Bathyarchaeia archaeon]
KLSVAVPSGTAAGKYVVVVTGTSGALSHSVNVTVNVVAPDFRLYAYPSSLSVAAGSTGNSTVLVSPLYGFNGAVSLSASCPSGWTATFSSSSLSLTNSYYGYYSYGNYNWSTLSVAVPSDAATGKYTVVVTGTSGSQTHSANITVTVVRPDFQLSAYPSSLSVTAGSTRNSTIMVTPLNKFDGTVSLSASVPGGWTATFILDSLSITNGYSGYNGYFGNSNWSRLSITVPSGAAVGKYTVVVTGTSGSLTHSVNITVNVVSPDFQLYVFPSYLSVSNGSTGNSNVLVSPLYGFNGTISLSASVPAGWTASFATSSLSLTNGYYYNWSTLSIAVPSDAVAGSYTVVVTGTSGTLTHSANITVTVGNFDFWRRS